MKGLQPSAPSDYEDVLQVIVKIPYWISVPRKDATASEAATLTFLRSKGIPIPGALQQITLSMWSISLWNIHPEFLRIQVGLT